MANTAIVRVIMKRTKIITASLLIMISLTGCSLFPTGENYSWGDKEAEVTVDDNNNASGKLNESIAINAEINEPDNVVWKEYSISQVEFSEKELDEIAGKLKFNSSIKKKNKGDGYYSIDYSDGSSFSHNTQGGAFTISYSTQQSTRRQYEHFLQDNSGNILGNEDINEMFPADEITGLSQDKAISQAKDICSKMNIDIYDTPYMCVAMDMEHANKLIEDNPTKGTDKNGNISYWEKNDEAYYMIFQQSVDNVPLTVSKKEYNFYAVQPSTVNVLVGKNGVIRVENHYLYDVNSSKDVTVINSAKVLNILATDSMYAAIGNMELTSLSLEYAVYKDLKNNTTVIKPVWTYTLERTYTTEKNGETYTRVNRQVNFIDAVTGKVLGV